MTRSNAFTPRKMKPNGRSTWRRTVNVNFGQCLVRAGYSDKYGQVYVERVGNTGFPDPDEPVALLRAQDKLAQKAIAFYHRLSASHRVTPEQRESVTRQVERFAAWAKANPTKMRLPGSAR
jgi:hypothetical protein